MRYCITEFQIFLLPPPKPPPPPLLTHLPQSTMNRGLSHSIHFLLKILNIPDWFNFSCLSAYMVRPGQGTVYENSGNLTPAATLRHSKSTQQMARWHKALRHSSQSLSVLLDFCLKTGLFYFFTVILRIWADLIFLKQLFEHILQYGWQSQWVNLYGSSRQWNKGYIDIAWTFFPFEHYKLRQKICAHR